MTFYKEISSQTKMIPTWVSPFWSASFPILFNKGATSNDWRSLILWIFWSVRTTPPPASLLVRAWNKFWNFLEPNNSKDLPKWSCSLRASVDKNSNRSVHFLCFAKECRLHIVTTRFSVIRFATEASATCNWSWQQRETAIRKSLLGFMSKKDSRSNPVWFNFLASVA